MLVPNETLYPSLRKSHGLIVHCQQTWSSLQLHQFPATCHLKLLVLVTVLLYRRHLESERKPLPMGACHQQIEVADRIRGKKG
ncbi:hypothetical protein Patl1_14828 [Pistacia atlantica]|uniref:Uncharacterized protein n=1 Tax=Pistacia atlantica TaxID=434234 RepID=A0ACC1ATJ5_9ROSI|nr:hypothetical protein Patl1_14828 [Pistacia atlantica]